MSFLSIKKYFKIYLDPVRTGTWPFILSHSQQNYKPTKIQIVVKGMHFEIAVYVLSHFTNLYVITEKFPLTWISGDIWAEITSKTFQWQKKANPCGRLSL